MGSRSRAVTLLLACAPMLVAARTLSAQSIPPSLFSALEWRMIGPFRGGRTVGATGVPGQPNVFYIGVNNGGVWKSTDYGRVWTPIFDDQPTGSIGDVAVAPSNPNIIYVATGEGLQRPDLATGDGVYKSTDAGRTWKHLGLREGQQIASIIVDPKNPDRVFAGVLGHPYGPNAERGVYRTTDGGLHWERVLYRDENTGAMQVAFDPTDSRIVYADLWAGRQAPWEIGGSFNGPGSGLFKSTDGGTTWKQLTAGLPTIAQGLGRIGIAIARTDSRRLYATVDGPAAVGGIYRSDDAGESWRRMNAEARLWERGSDFAEIQVHPRNADIVFVANTSSYKSIDGAKTFTAIKGAPGGDDYHRIWINPENPDIMLFAADQGATLTVNGGATWSSWYNQPTAQFYHVITDNRVPYWVYGGQQESGSAGVISRGDNGAITFRDWRTIGVEEYGYVAPDPLDPNIIYGGKISRFDHRTGEVQNISPEPVRSGKYRFVRTMPVIFSPVDPKSLFLASNVLFKTTTGGRSWEIVSPDLTRETYEVPKSLGIFTALDPEKGRHRGVIYSVAPSFRNAAIIWAGTDDGLIHVTRDGGKSWKNVTPPALTPWSKVSQLTASHFDDETAYAAVNRFRLDDLRPHIYRTHDGGSSWQEITRGIPDNEVVNAVREDPVRKGMLYAGSERAVYVSWDDGQSWQSLRLNMPATSIRDLVIHDDDIILGTHGRSFWILDDISPLRQIAPRTGRSTAVLFKPRVTYRFRRNKNTDTPLPPEEPAGRNPPDGAIIYYYLGARSSGPVTISIHDADGTLIRRFSSLDRPDSIASDLNVPLYWLRPFQAVSTAAGMHRFVWDLHHVPPSVAGFNYPISAIIHDTPREPLGPAVAPGEYRVTLAAGGKTYTQPLTIRMDPRTTMTGADLTEQERTGLAMLEATRVTWSALGDVRKLRTRVAEARTKGGPIAPADVVTALATLEPRLAGIETGAAPVAGLVRLNAEAAALLGDIEGADMPLTSQMVAKASEITGNVTFILRNWRTIQADIERMSPSVRRALGRGK